MSRIIRIGLSIDPKDAFWVQVREAAYQQARLLGLDLISIIADDYPQERAADKQLTIVEELLGQELDAMIGWDFPELLAYRLLEAGVPIIHSSETNVRHPLSVSPLGLYDVAKMLGQYLAEQLQFQGNVLIVGGLLQADLPDDGRSRVAGLQDAFRDHPRINFVHIPSAWSYEQGYSQIYAAMRRWRGPIDAIVGLSDSLALAGRDAGRALGLVDRHPLIVGINGDPAALAAITEGSMAATVETSATDLGCQAVDLAFRAARRLPLPAHFPYTSRLVTPQNVAEVAMQKLIAIADLPDRLVGIRRREQQQRLMQLETSLEISRQIGSILDRQQLAHEIARLICTTYGYDQAYIFLWLEQEQVLVLDQVGASNAGRITLPLDEADTLRPALQRNEVVFIPDTRRSARFAPDRYWPDTISRVVVPIRLGERILGLLDLHSYHPTHTTRQEMVGLQSLAAQLGVAMRNAELYSEALEARSRAEKADQLKTRLLANVSHELRTPLNVILDHTQAAIDHSTAYTNQQRLVQVKHLHPIQQNAAHLLRVINDLLDLSRAEIDELDLYTEVMDIRPLLEEVFQSMAHQAASESAVIWHLELPEQLPPIRVDPTRLRQILLNLLGNAHKFTTQGLITLGAELAPPHLHIWVEDTGVGIPIDLQERVFEPFVTGFNPGRQREGIGLGLSIARRLVALHHGSIALQSQPGHGTIVHVYLPLPSLDEHPLPFPETAQPTLLLISAHDRIPDDIVTLSQRHGLELRQLHPDGDLDGALVETQPAVLAWNLAEARRGDWATIQRLRSHPWFFQLPFLIYGQEQGEGAQLALGMTNFVLKPTPLHTLREAVGALCPPGTAGPVLIVDDDHQARQLYQELVIKELKGYPVRSVGDGAAAIALMADEVPSIVILDLNMPGMDGFDVLDWMRANLVTRRVPVLVLSGRALTFEDVKRLEQHALVTFQSKDVLSEDEIAHSLQQVLSGSPALAQSTSNLVKRTLAYIHQHFNHPLSRNEIAQAVGVTDNYLSRIFRQELGLSPWEYLARYRITRAKELLRITNASVGDVALQVGFDDAAYFTRVFHKHVGCSPTAYRRQAE